MKFHELKLSRNRHLTIFEKNGVNKLFDDKTKRMPEDLFDELSDIEVLEVEESVGTVIVLDIGKTAEQLEEDSRKAEQATKDFMRKIGMTSMLLMSSFGGCHSQEEETK